MSLFSDSRGTTRVLVVQHSERAPGGHFCRELLDQGAQLVTVKVFENDSLPFDAEEFDGLVVLGGRQHACDDEAGPHFKTLMEFMRQFDGQRKPVAGICLGCQLLARTYGGRVWSLESPEFGFIQHTLTVEAAPDPVVGGIPLPPLMEFHEDTFDLPVGATLLMEGSLCRNQGFKVGNSSYGFQAHLEVDPETMEEWLLLFSKGEEAHYGKYRSTLDEAGLGDLLGRLPSLLSESESYCRKVSRNWLALTRKKCSFRVLNG